jgi:signal transduction histidine kinase
MFLDDRSPLPTLHYAAGTLVLLSLLVLLLLTILGTSVLDRWLMVVIGMLISEMTLVTFGLTTRFSLGWYVSRGLAVGFSTVVLVILLFESSRLYATLSRAYVALRRERNNKLISVKAATSSMAHEIRQPLAAITANASAARTWLDKTPPVVDELKSTLDSIKSDSFRAAEVLESLPTMFDASDYDQQLIDVNQLAVETVQILRGEMNDHGVKTAVELAPELSPVMGHRVQLRQAILNLFQNAIEASASVEIERRILKVRTRRDGDQALIIEVEDSGPGIEKECLPRVFEAFVTTKPNGTGLGLTISKRIAQLHGGRLNASSDGKNGALFQLFLPVAPIEVAADEAERRDAKIKED